MMLEELNLGGKEALDPFSPRSLGDISAISKFKKLRSLDIGGKDDLKDLSPLLQCSDLEELYIDSLPNINRLSFIEDLSWFNRGFTKLRSLSISFLQINGLSPLAKLESLEELIALGIPSTTSLTPLASCLKLKSLVCNEDEDGRGNSESLAELRRMMPDLKINEVDW